MNTLVNELRANNYIREKAFGNISSFNFTREAFLDSIWTEQTMVARGLYVNTKTDKIVARGFNKFFNIGERSETTLEALKNTLQFPVVAYVKENGYLGLVSYNEETDDLFITTKSNPEGEYAVWLREALVRTLSGDALNTLKTFCKNNNVTFVFENVNMDNDPHIIEYDGNKLFLLSIIKNDLTFSQYPYEKVCKLGTKLGLKVKEKAYTLTSYDNFIAWFNEVTSEGWMYNNRHIEGFVIEDANGYMTKVKLFYYTFWKRMRGVLNAVMAHGVFKYEEKLTTPIAKDFYEFCKKVYNNSSEDTRATMPKDIITFRNAYFDYIHSPKYI